jgi:hypothetical protein
MLSAAATYAPKNIRVNCVAPGLTRTPLAARITSNAAVRPAPPRPACCTQLPALRSGTAERGAVLPTCSTRSVVTSNATTAASIRHPNRHPTAPNRPQPPPPPGPQGVRVHARPEARRGGGRGRGRAGVPDAADQQVRLLGSCRRSGRALVLPPRDLVTLVPCCHTRSPSHQPAPPLPLLPSPPPSIESPSPAL